MPGRPDAHRHFPHLRRFTHDITLAHRRPAARRWCREAENQGFLYYRKDLLAKEGLSGPATREQLEADSVKLVQASLVKYRYVWEGDGGNRPDRRRRLAGDVELVEALGSEQVVHFTIDAKRILAEGAVGKDEAAVVKSGEGVARVAAKTPVKPGDKLACAVSVEDMQFFDEATGLAIRA